MQADLKTCAALGVYGTCAITAQNTCGVTGVHAVPADAVLTQIEAVLDDLAVAAVKTGVLATPALVSAVDVVGDGASTLTCPCPRRHGQQPRHRLHVRRSAGRRRADDRCTPAGEGLRLRALTGRRGGSATATATDHFGRAVVRRPGPS